MAEPLIHPGAYRLTYSDWLELPEDGKLYEILGGELFVTPPPAPQHQRISVRLLSYLIPYLQSRGKGEVFHAPLGVKLTEEDVPEPDLVVVLAEHGGRIGEQVVEGPPDLVVEILSPGTAGRDLGLKRSLYERHGIPEYWIVDPRDLRIQVLVLEGGTYTSFGLFHAGETLRSRLLPELAIPVAEVIPPAA